MPRTIIMLNWLEALVVSDLVPLWQPVVTVTASTENHFATPSGGLVASDHRPAGAGGGDHHILANRGEGITRVAGRSPAWASQSSPCKRPCGTSKTTALPICGTNCRTIARLLAQQPGTTAHRDGDAHAPFRRDARSVTSTSGPPLPMRWADW